MPTKVDCVDNFLNSGEVQGYSPSALDPLIQEVIHCNQQQNVNRERITDLLDHIKNHPLREAACEILVRSGNTECQDIAVEHMPLLGELCAHEIMETSRKLIREIGVPASSEQAQCYLRFARKWYSLANALTPDREFEIYKSLEATKWTSRR